MLYCVLIHVVYVGHVLGGGFIVSFFTVCVIFVLGFLMYDGSSQCEMGCPNIFCASSQLFWMFFVIYLGRRGSGGSLFFVWGLSYGLLFSMLVLIVSLYFSYFVMASGRLWIEGIRVSFVLCMAEVGVWFVYFVSVCSFLSFLRSPRQFCVLFMAAEKGVERSFWMIVFLLLVMCFGWVFVFLFSLCCLYGLCFISSWETIVSTP